jgi:esterase
MEATELSYEELGEKHAPPLIILHGFFASSRNWRRIAERLSTAFHVYVLDMRNHGNSPHHELMDYPSMIADVLRFMDDHSLSSAHIMGHSMGGKCAMWLALNHPDRINKLVVVDIAPKSYQHSFNKLIMALINLPLDEIHNRKQAEAGLAIEIPELEYRQFLLQNLILKENRFSWRVNLDIFFHMAPNIIAFPESQKLKPYTGETLFVAGETSNYVSSEDTLQLFPKAKFRVIAKAGHWLHAQQPQVFTELVENFLQRG